MNSSNTAFFICVISFLGWGLLSIYWSELSGVDPIEIVAHRAVWSAIFAGILVIIMGEGIQIRNAFTHPKLFFTLFCSSILIAINWGVYIWAVKQNHIVETSMGYYINPLLNVAASALIFKIPLNRFQMLAIALAVIGVANMIIGYGSVPWVALLLATSFCLYGVIRKIAPIDALPGLLVETLIIAVPSAIYIIFLTVNGQGAFYMASERSIVMLLLGGVITTLPLAGFSYGAKHLNLSTVGVIQYLSPTTSFMIGIFVYHEVFTKSHLISFIFIWIGLLVYTIDSIVRLNKPKRTSVV